MSEILRRWNELRAEDAEREVLHCCGSTAWARALAARRPFASEDELLEASDRIWSGLGEQDWMEAFATHPRIGQRKAPETASSQSASWSAQEQKGVGDAEEAVRAALAEGNRKYEQRFGRVFLVCATGKSAEEMLAMLRRRLNNDAATEMREAAEEQRKITNIRIRKWLQA